MSAPAFESLHAEFARLLKAEATGDVIQGPVQMDEPAGLAVAHRFAFYMGVGHGNVAATDAFTHWFTGLEDPTAYILEWREAYKDLALHERENRLAFLAPYIGRWVRFERLHSSVKLLGTVALYIVIEEGLYQDFIDLFQRSSGLKLSSSFKSPADFVAAIRQACGWGSTDPSRINHDLKAAGFWLEIEAADLPVPPNLSRIEKLASEDDRLEIYRRLVEASENAAPAHTAITEFLADRNGQGSQPSAESLILETKRRLEEAIQALSAPQPDVEGALKTLRDLDKRVTPKPRTKKKKGKAKEKEPPYDARLGCPFVLQEDGGDHLSLTLAHPIPSKVHSRIWQRACRHGWEPLDTDIPTKARQWRIPLSSTNASQAHAQRPEIHTFLKKLCLRMKAPLPTLPDRIQPPAAA